MKISKYIEELQKVQDKYGDLEVMKGQSYGGDTPVSVVEVDFPNVVQAGLCNSPTCDEYHIERHGPTPGAVIPEDSMVVVMVSM